MLGVEAAQPLVGSHGVCEDDNIVRCSVFVGRSNRQHLCKMFRIAAGSCSLGNDVCLADCQAVDGDALAHFQGNCYKSCAFLAIGINFPDIKDECVGVVVGFAILLDCKGGQVVIKLGVVGCTVFPKSAYFLGGSVVRLGGNRFALAIFF